MDLGCNTKKQTVLFAENDYLIGLLAMGSSRKIRLWSQKKLDTPLHTMDLDSNAGQLVGHYDNDNKVLYVAGKGDSTVKYFEIDYSANQIYYLAAYQDTANAQKGVCFLPKKGLDVGKCEIARCMRIFNDAVVSVSLQVPRKSDLFQKDLYPDAYAGVAALSASEWWGGQNKPPPTVSMNPSSAKHEGGAAAPAAPKTKSSKEYEEEIAALKKRVAELEAELAK